MTRKSLVATSTLLLLFSLSLQTTLGASRSSPSLQQLVLKEINSARSTTRRCGSTTYRAAPPVAWNNKLASAARSHSRDMATHNFFSHTGSDGLRVSDRVNASGYTWRALGENIAAGTKDVKTTVAAWLRSSGHCRTIMNSALSEIGAGKARSRNSDYGIYWTLVMADPRDKATQSNPSSQSTEPSSSASPSPTTNPSSNSSVEQSMLAEINRARAASRRCGGRSFGATSPLAWNNKLEAAARGHSQDMAQNNFFSHTGSDGLSMVDRVNAQGYAWSRLGENIAAGTKDASATVALWLDSPGHCASIMNPAFTQTGAASATSSGSDYGTYWTLDLATPR